MISAAIHAMFGSDGPSAYPQEEDPGIRIFCHAAYSLDGKPIPLPLGADIDDVNECISDAIEEALWDM